MFEHRAKTLERLLRKRNEGVCLAGDKNAQFAGFKSGIEMTVTTQSRLDINDNINKIQIMGQRSSKVP